jgi:hypothetical protein
MTRLTNAERAAGLALIPDSYTGPRNLLPGELDQFIACMVEHHENANWPVKLDLNYDGDNWAPGWGVAQDENGDDLEVYVTTDHVHCSEIRGGALEDGECYVFLRNALPQIIHELKRLLAYERMCEEAKRERDLAKLAEMFKANP